MQAKYRLKSRKSFTYIYKKGKGIRQGYITLITVPSRWGKQFGFVAGKKVGGAVVRNKVRRRLKEIIRLLLPKIQGNTNYVLVANAGIAELSFDELEKNVKKVFRNFLLDGTF